MTAVLPDHVHTGQWSYFEERFPVDAFYLLASDGFYGCFSEPEDIWHWLIDAEDQLLDELERPRVMRTLHQHRHREHGDDDISFVWVTPESLEYARQGSTEENENERANT